jgi:CelD/BcsL family acetyltransferase involved in cellulose biosynthesis
MDNFGESQSPLVVGRGGCLTGVLPLTLPRSGRPRACRIAGSNLGDRFHPACDVADEVGVARAAGTALADAEVLWSVLALEKVELTAPWVDALAEATG